MSLGYQTRSVASLTVVVVAIFFSSKAALAVTLSDSIDGNTPLSTIEWCDANDRAVVRPFTVSVSGTYGFSNLNVDNGVSGANLFVQINTQPEPAYEPLINDDTYGNSPVAAAPTGSLVAGTQYYFVAVTACTDGALTPVTFTVELTGAGAIAVEGDGSISSPVDAIPNVVATDVFAQSRATISGNTRMMDMALTRFLSDLNSSAGDIISRDDIKGPLGLQVTGFDLEADDDGGFLFSSMSYMDVANGWRRVGFAELNFQDTQGVGSTLSVNGRISQERYLTDSTLYGYFLGAELQRSNIEGSFAGDQNSWGVLAGAYTMTEVANGLVGSAYASLGFNRSDLNIASATTTVTDTYDTRSVMLGSKLSGDLDYTTYRLRPSLAANYAQTDIGTLSMTETTSGTESALSVPVGTVRFVDVIATPEFVFDIDPIGEGFSETEFSVGPRLTCERRDAVTDTRNCGSGLALGLTSNSSDGMTTLNGAVSFDRIGGQDRRSIQLQAEMRF